MAMNAKQIAAISTLLTASLSALTIPAFAQDGLSERGVGIVQKAVGQGRLNYDKRYAVVVGINKYPKATGKFMPLDGAVNDATRVAKKLNELGFDEVKTLFDVDADRDAIIEALADHIGKKATENDFVIFYFAGHGDTQDGSKGQMGYVLPYDYDPSRHTTTSISMTQLKEISETIKAKHVLYAMDSCFSGGITKTRAAVPAGLSRDALQYLKNQMENRAHVVITAGGAKEVAHEKGGQGIFTSVLLEGLAGKADRGGNGFVMASELALYIQQRMPAYLDAGRKQNPQYAVLDGEGDVLVAMLKLPDISSTPQSSGDAARVAEQALRQKLEKEYQEKMAREREERERTAVLDRDRMLREQKEAEQRLEHERELARIEREQAEQARHEAEQARGHKKPKQRFVAPSF
jgi:hypothetical protein